MESSLERGRAVLAAQSFSVMLGARMTVCDDRQVVIELPITDTMKQNDGFVHGGVIAYLADIGLAFSAGLALGAPVVTAEIKVNYLRPAIGELLIARAHALGAGRTQGVSRCDIFIVLEGLEKLCAAAQGTVLRAASRTAEDQRPGV